MIKCVFQFANKNLQKQIVLLLLTATPSRIPSEDTKVWMDNAADIQCHLHI